MTTERGQSPTKPLLWPVVGTVVFVVIVPGMVVGYVPFRLSRWEMATPFFGWAFLRWLGVFLIAGGLPLFIDFLIRFVYDGRGTPAPIAPTQHLVVTGSFRYVRNPGYIAVTALLLGQALLFASAAVLIYACIVFAAFHVAVVAYEERTLRRQFGAEYERYCRQVPRWMPRLTPAPIHLPEDPSSPAR
jgi:protein-S-isoprenylcysteine O-methyltransferase Ste14